MRTLIKRAAKTTVATGALLALAVPALAATSSFGPQSWSDGTQTGRYRAHTGNHYILLKCSSGRYNVDLRVDVISNPDISEGYYSYACNSTGVVGGHIDSYLSQYRGHFMQSRSAWYGTLSDTHS